MGSLLRTAEGLGVEQIYLTGYTPYPRTDYDERLPHVAAKIHKQIQKTALGAEELALWKHIPDVLDVIKSLQQQGFTIAGLEQTKASKNITKWQTPSKVAVVIGRETLGIETNVLNACDKVLEIPMFGRKESFNVVQAAAMALYHCKFVG